MAFTDTPDSSTARLTEGGRTYLARSIYGEVAIKLTGFDVGHAGYVDANPVKVQPVIPSNTSLDSKYFPATPAGVEPFVSIERPHPKTLVLNCRLDHSDPSNIGAIGEVGIWGEVVMSEVPSEVGTKFLFAIAHFPILTKNLQNVFVFRILTQF
jgi:hypothetical protein